MLFFVHIILFLSIKTSQSNSVNTRTNPSYNSYIFFHVCRCLFKPSSNGVFLLSKLLDSLISYFAIFIYFINPPRKIHPFP
ncbi:hypothetical protein CW304_18145 [Bacillus sp. UFRGS-B20]|nr:hypothetical protein CW304_18145 [Bacillus sp. UFRGS-B20]